MDSKKSWDYQEGWECGRSDARCGADYNPSGGRDRVLGYVAGWVGSEGPTPGTPATVYSGSDRKAATVIAVSHNGKTITVQIDKATRADSLGQSEHQEYRYERNPNGEKVVATLRKDGKYHRQGYSLIHGDVVGIGSRCEYHDPHF